MMTDKQIVAEDRFAKPHDMDGLSMAFGGNTRELMPSYNDIPKEFRDGRTKWNKFQSDWFYAGISVAGLVPKDGIDKQKALAHLKAINVSFEPKHEHKEAGVAYLASRWFKDESTWARVKP